MRKYILTYAFVICTLGLVAQSQNSSITTVEIGDVFEIGKPDGNTYKHIDFPRPNIIIKRGGIVSFRGIEGSIVTVSAIKKKNDGTLVTTLTRKDGKRFFGSHTIVKADYMDALQSGELQAK